MSTSGVSDTERLGVSYWTGGNGEFCIRLKLLDETDVPRPLVITVGDDLLVDETNVADGESAVDEAEEARGYHRAVVTLVEPAHQAIDLLEPCPPREVEGQKLTPAGRVEWYREHRFQRRRPRPGDNNWEGS